MHFRSHPAYADLVDLFHETTYQTAHGQMLDVKTAPIGTVRESDEGDSKRGCDGRDMGGVEGAGPAPLRVSSRTAVLLALSLLKKNHRST